MTKYINLEQPSERREKTIFTHYLNGNVKGGWIKIEGQEFNSVKYEKVIYLGNCIIDGDMFACYKDDAIMILKGLKGSEF
jgi:hypothetical protein